MTTTLAAKTGSAEEPKNRDFTMVKNDLIFCLDLTPAERLVAMAMQSYKLGVWASQVTLAEKLGVNRKTVMSAMTKLAEMGLAEETGRGRMNVARYKLHYDRIPPRARPEKRQDCRSQLSNKRTGSCPVDGQVVVPFTDTSNSKHLYEIEKDVSDVTSTSEITSGEPGSPLRDDVMQCYQDELSCPKNGQLKYLAEQSNATRKLTNAIVNEELLGPDGSVGWTGTVEELADFVNYVVLLEVGGKLFPVKSLKWLADKYGIERCFFVARWLARKVAYEYEVNKSPVKNPTGLYRRCVEEGFFANLGWPEFDPDKHTWKAKEENGFGRSWEDEFSDSYGATDEPAKPASEMTLDDLF
jgi:predicted transcriptional regulator